MQKEDVLVISHLLTAIKDAITKLEEAQRKKDNEQFLAAKREIIKLQEQVGKII